MLPRFVYVALPEQGNFAAVSTLSHLPATATMIFYQRVCQCAVQLSDCDP